jgi:hypothetical protein
MKKLKVIQMTSSIDSVGKYFIVAVCEDGSIWQMGKLYEGNIEWTELPRPERPVER